MLKEMQASVANYMQAQTATQSAKQQLSESHQRIVHYLGALDAAEKQGQAGQGQLQVVVNEEQQQQQPRVEQVVPMARSPLFVDNTYKEKQAVGGVDAAVNRVQPQVAERQTVAAGNTNTAAVAAFSDPAKDKTVNANVAAKTTPMTKAAVPKPKLATAQPYFGFVPRTAAPHDKQASKQQKQQEEHEEGEWTPSFNKYATGANATPVKLSMGGRTRSAAVRTTAGPVCNDVGEKTDKDKAVEQEGQRQEDEDGDGKGTHDGDDVDIVVDGVMKKLLDELQGSEKVGGQVEYADSEELGEV